MMPLDSADRGARLGDLPLRRTASEEAAPKKDPFDEQVLLDLFKEYKRVCFQAKFIFERQWLRNIFYILGHQWIHYHPVRGWIERRLATWIPKPVTNKIDETVVSLVAMCAAIKLGVNISPNGDDPKNVVAAGVADAIEPEIRADHLIDRVQAVSDWWLAATGNVFWHLFWDKDKQAERVPLEACAACHAGPFTPDQIVEAQQHCPACGQGPLMPAGTQDVRVGRGSTRVFSGFDIGLPPGYDDFDDVPYLIVRRWHDKKYYEDTYDPSVVKGLTWEKAPNDQGGQALRAIATRSEIGGMNADVLIGGASYETDGKTEYELWQKPGGDYPDGLFARFCGEGTPILLAKADEHVPGPVPYHDQQGRPLWPWTHTTFEKVGGRIWGRTPIDRLIAKQDALNRLDSRIELTVDRCANPAWVGPKSSRPQGSLGVPGIWIDWDPLVLNGQGEPKRIPGQDIPPTLFQLRAQLLTDIEELAGTFDIIKGAKPQGVEAFSAMQLLVERGQSRFSTLFTARGETYTRWYILALELERTFGPTERVLNELGPNRTFTFKHFLNADLQGNISILPEPGTNAPKTALGRRASIQQGQQMGALDLTDPDQKLLTLTQLGIPEFVPSLSAQVSSAQQLQEAFEDWVRQGGPQQYQQALAQYQAQIAPIQAQMQKEAALAARMGQPPPAPPPMPPPPETPLTIYEWYDAKIHLTERLKWLNSDRMRAVINQAPVLVELLTAHVRHLKDLVNTPAPPPVLGGAPGAAQAMENSNRESTQNIVPGGTYEGPQRQGPM